MHFQFEAEYSSKIKETLKYLSQSVDDELESVRNFVSHVVESVRIPVQDRHDHDGVCGAGDQYLNQGRGCSGAEMQGLFRSAV